MVEMTSPPPPPAPGDVHLWFFEAATLQPCLESLHGDLSDPDREASDHYVTEVERRRFSLYRGAFRRVLSWYEGCRTANLAISRGRHGKPSHRVVSPVTSPEKREEPDSGISFNITHSHEYSVLAVGLNAELGIDVERIRLPRDLSSLVRQFFCSEEIAAVEAASPEQRARLFCSIWTRKEAAVKYMGGSLAEWIGVLQVTRHNPGSPIVQDGVPELYLTEFTVGAGYLGCLCTDYPSPRITSFRLSCSGWSFRDERH